MTGVSIWDNGIWGQCLPCLRKHWRRHCTWKLNAHNVDEEDIYEHRISWKYRNVSSVQRQDQLHYDDPAKRPSGAAVFRKAYLGQGRLLIPSGNLRKTNDLLCLRKWQNILLLTYILWFYVIQQQWLTTAGRIYQSGVQNLDNSTMIS